MSNPPLPDDSIDPIYNVRGWWVTFERVFLFLPAPGPHQSFTELTIQSGAICYGFNAEFIAEKFREGGLPITVSDLILNNRIGSLAVTESEGIITPGSERALDFTFELPTGHKVRAEVKTARITGRA